MDMSMDKGRDRRINDRKSDRTDRYITRTD